MTDDDSPANPSHEHGSDAATAAMQAELFLRLATLGIKVQTVDYPPHKTVEEGRALRGQMSGCFTKNLLLRDKKGKLFLIVAQEDRSIDLKTLHRSIGANGRLGFAPGEQMREVLSVEPGALTPLALLFDRDRQVTPVIDGHLLREEQVNFHPLTNTQSTGIDPRDLLKFIEACGHIALVVCLDDGRGSDSFRLDHLEASSEIL
jgi:Ala-tRNA(Pro) deacylase